ncbi:Tat pathway signal sequence domain protein [Actinoplanes sp. KI2]|uniref:LamG-like jellyroll fold domain-containing protein n=1 Tax=Actinoplanes sp. KI2 TaxID=2983315 RepID=UPI0021D59815|nr:LamG-like jellyroll fold domain-containing protein [Actinoplanes sp. KI2]MCU7730098.1 Tat pathway signal sequence domain protein [Actinoplanes sp. KI2]
MREHDHGHGPAGPSRRNLLRAGALAGAGAAATFWPLSATPAPAGSWRSGGPPDPAAPQFTLAIMPDTQFLYWGSQGSINPAPQEASFRYIVDSADDNIVFMAHLGDLTQDGSPASFAAVGKSFDLLDSYGVGYSVLAGNHDVSGDDTRGTTPYLQTMGPQRFGRWKTFAGSDAGGYNTAHIFRAGGREWLLLALDWRMSAQGFAWANRFIADHPRLPVILTTHDLVGSSYDDTVYPYESGDPEDNAVLSGYGRQLWDGLINDNDQIFLGINGHHWPPGRTTIGNAAGNDVHLHITNYQNRYFGGAAMLRLYHFDLARNVIDVETVAPYFLAQDADERSPLAAQHLRLTTPVDLFSMPIDFAKRFAGFLPVPPRPARPANRMVVPGTLAYWRFDSGGVSGSPVGAGETVRDLSGRGNDLTVAVVPGSAADALTWSGDHHPDQPGHAGLRLVGGRNPLHGAYLTTGPAAPLNAETFNHGYTIEAFLKIPLDWDGGNNAWMSVLTRRGQAGAAGKSGKNTDPKEPLAGLSISNNGREPQFNFYPLSQTYPTTNWGHGLFEEVWWHVAVVNDGKHTIMYVEGSPVLDNPSTLSVGIASLGLPWLLGGHEYAGAVDNVFHGWIGDVRVVNRPLPANQFMNAK